MRIIGAIAVVLALAWTGFWFFAQSQIEARLSDAIAVAAEQGTQVRTSELEVKGFPYRFEVKARGLTIETADQELHWQLPALNIHALAYQPQKLLIDFPYQQELRLFGQPITLAAEPMRASVRFEASPNLPLQEGRWEATALSLSSEYGWRLSAAHMLAALRLDPMQDEENHLYDAYWRVRDLVVPEGLRQALDPEGGLPATLSEVAFNGKFHLTDPIDVHQGAATSVDAFDIDDMHFTWGPIHLAASTSLQRDYSGAFKGEVTITVVEWQKALDLVKRTGALQGDRALMAERALQSVAQGNRLEITLPVNDNAIYLGPMRLWSF